MCKLSHFPVGFLCHTVRNQQDRQRYIDFNATSNNFREGATCDCLLNHHPHTTGDDFWMVEDQSNGQVVSTTCLLPWNANFSGIDLKIAQLEMVVTHRAYRGRGLVRTQIDQFHQVIKERHFDLSIIWGIPYFYRQFGYTYTIEGDACEVLSPWQIPDSLPGGFADIRLSPATPKDISILVSLYKQANNSLDFSIHRDPAYWQYLMVARHPILMVEDNNSGKNLGYVILKQRPEEVIIYENSLSSHWVAGALLKQLKLFSNQPIIIRWPEESLLVKFARSLGSQTRYDSQWLVRIPEIPGFIQKMKPLLESRLSEAQCQDLTTTIIINLYQEAYEIQIVDGKLKTIKSIGFRDYSMGTDGGDLCLPGDAFVRLITGFKSLDQLREAWPDVFIKPQARFLLKILFPPMKSYLNTPYHLFE